MDLLGDKLTAFAPHTTGIPFFKHEVPFFMEIMKQLYDISSILDRIDDLSVVRKTYAEIVPIELGYRKLEDFTEADVLNDTYQSAMNICLRGALNRTEFSYYADGARRVNSQFCSLSVLCSLLLNTTYVMNIMEDEVLQYHTFRKIRTDFRTLFWKSK